MEKERIGLIIRNMESLLDCLKKEIDTDDNYYKSELNYETISAAIRDYDEVYYDEGEEV